MNGKAGREVKQLICILIFSVSHVFIITSLFVHGTRYNIMVILKN